MSEAIVRAQVSTASTFHATLSTRVFNVGDGPVYEAGVYEPGTYMDWNPARFVLILLDRVGDLQNQLVPQTEQRVSPLRWSINGVPVPDELVLESSIDVSTDGEGWSLSLAAWADDPAIDEPYGDPVETGALPADKQTVDCEVVYLTEIGPRTVKLMTGGIVENSDLDLDTGVRRISGMGPRGRWIDKVAEYLLPRGHGKTRAEVCAELLRRAGLDEPGIDDVATAKMYKAVEVSDEEVVELCDEILDAELKRLEWTAEGDVDVVDLIPADDTADLVIDEDLMLRGQGAFESAHTDGPTMVIVTADIPVTREGCDLETRITRTEVFMPYGPKAPSHEVDGSCNVTASSLTSAPVVLRKVQENVLTQQVQCGSIISETVEVFGYYNPLRAFRQLDGGGAATYTCNATLIDDPEGEGRQLTSETWMKVSEDTLEKTFDERGYLVREERERFGWYLPRAALKERTLSSQDWESRNFIADRFVMVAGDAVAYADEAYQKLERVVTDYSVVDEGFITAADTVIESFVAALGDFWLYNGGDEKAEEFETFQTSQTVSRRWVVLPDERLREIETVVGIDEPGPVITEITSDGHYPAAEILEDAIGRIEYFAEAGEGGASYYESQPVVVSIDDQEAAAVLNERVDKVHHDWIETQAEAEAYADHLLRVGRRLTVTAVIPINAAVRPRDWIDVDLPTIGKSYKMLAARVSHGERGGVMTTTVEGDHFLGT